MLDHEQFAELCALAAIGELTAEQMQQLEAHAAQCGDCRMQLRQFREVVQTWLPLADDGRRHPVNALSMKQSSRRAREAFLARARREGLQLSAVSAPHGGFWSTAPWFRVRSHLGAAVAVIMLAFAATGVALWSPRITTQRNYPQPQSRTEPTKNQSAGLETQLSVASSLNAEQTRTIATLEKERTELQRRARDTDEQFEASQRQVQQLQAELANSNLASNEAQQRLAAELRRAEDLNGQINSLREARTQDQASIVAAQVKILELSEQVRLQAVSLDRESALLAASRDVRDLMSARNLHILDVHDFDVKGKAQRSFGRVFYTEGKSLIFYAYDLPTRMANNPSFQAWGQKADGSKQAINLGLLYVDDQKQSRWALKFDDAGVLRQIDSVFVTIEPPGGTKQPSGRKLLYAWLGNDPNHP
jgi:DNA repair exonuclease SbcCD ATPase subunit